MIITDKDVQEISDYFYNHGNLPGDMQPKILSGLKECLTLREQKRKLVENSNRLAEELFGWLGSTQFRPIMPGDSAMINHNNLMKELEE
jgi:hypothetical protein